MTASTYQLTNGTQVRRQDDGAFVPDNPELHARKVYDDFVAAGGAADSADVLSLVEAKDQATGSINAQAEVEFARYLPQGQYLGIVELDIYFEAVTADGDDTITAGEYPLLEARVPHDGVDVAAVATKVLVDHAARRASLATIEDVRRQAHADLDVAAGVAAVDAVMAGLTWP